MQCGSLSTPNKIPAVIRSIGVGILILPLRNVLAFCGEIEPPPTCRLRDATTASLDWRPRCSLDLRAHGDQDVCRASSVSRDSVGRSMNIIMKIGGRRRQRGCARHKDSCEARSTTSIVLLRSSRFSSTCYRTAIHVRSRSTGN